MAQAFSLWVFQSNLREGAGARGFDGQGVHSENSRNAESLVRISAFECASLRSRLRKSPLACARGSCAGSFHTDSYGHGSLASAPSKVASDDGLAGARLKRAHPHTRLRASRQIGGAPIAVRGTTLRRDYGRVPQHCYAPGQANVIPLSWPIRRMYCFPSSYSSAVFRCSSISGASNDNCARPCR